MIRKNQVVIDHDQKYLLPVLNMKCLNAQIEDMTDPYGVFSFPGEDLTLKILTCSPQTQLLITLRENTCLLNL